MDNGDAAKPPPDADDVSNPRDVGNSHSRQENSDDDDDVTINTEDDDDDIGDDITVNTEEEDDDDDENGVQRIGIDGYDDDDDEENDSQGHQKKRKMKALMSSYEFAPRLPNPSPPPSATKPSPGGRNPLTDWTEPETFVLLTAWGERFLKQGRKSLRSEQWQEVAEKVNHESKIARTETQCRNRLDTLKKKYKKDKAKFGNNRPSNWVYFEKIDSLLHAENPKEKGLTDSKNPKIGSPEEESDELPPKKVKSTGNNNGRTGAKSSSSFDLLADSINKFSEVYEKIERSSRRQLEELEKMREDFSRDLEMQKKVIVERAQAEIEKIRRGLYEGDGFRGKNR